MDTLEIYEKYGRLKIESRSANLRRVADIIERESRINIAFFGTFSAGKSALMNALIGLKLLPSSPLPTTSKITSVVNSKESFIRIFYATGLQDQIALTATDLTVGEPVSKKILENIHEISAVDSYEIHYPLQGFPNAVKLIDTPGVNSSDSKHSVEAESFLPKADIVILALNASQPLQAIDVEFLKKVTATQFLIILLNKVDLIDISEQSVEDIIERVNESLKGKLQQSQYAIYPVCAKREASPADNPDPADAFPEFASKLKSITRGNYQQIIQKKQNVAIRSFWPTMEDDYSADLAQFHNNKKSVHKKIRLWLFAVLSTIAISVLGYYSLDLYVEYYLKELSNRSEPARAIAVEKLGSWPRLSIPRIKKRLADKSTMDFERASILSALGIMGDSAQELNAEIRHYMRHENTELAKAAMQAYQNAGLYEKLGVTDLIVQAKHANRSVRVQALNTLIAILSRGSSEDLIILKTLLANIDFETQVTGSMIQVFSHRRHESNMIGPYLLRLAMAENNAQSAEAIAALGNLQYQNPRWFSFLMRIQGSENHPLATQTRSALNSCYPEEYSRIIQKEQNDRAIKEKAEEALLKQKEANEMAELEKAKAVEEKKNSEQDRKLNAGTGSHYDNADSGRNPDRDEQPSQYVPPGVSTDHNGRIVDD